MDKIIPVPRTGFIIGSLKDELTGEIPDFFEPMDENDLALWEGPRKDNGHRDPFDRIWK